jgi:VanZ family protein
MSLLPGNSGIMTWFGIPHFDKLLHAGGYGLLNFLWLFAMHKIGGNMHVRFRVVSFLCFIMGCLLEGLQYYMHAGRSFDVWDMAANGVGVIGGVFFFRMLSKLFNKGSFWPFV